MIQGKKRTSILLAVLWLTMVARGECQQYPYAPVAQPVGYYQEPQDQSVPADDSYVISEDVPMWWQLRSRLQEMAPCLYGDDLCQRYWTATADAVVLHRNASHRQTLLTDSSSQTEVLNSHDMDFSYAVGPRLSLIRHELCGLEVEVNYFSIESWEATAERANSSFPSRVGSLTLDESLKLPVNSAAFDQHTRMYSSELNVRLPYCSRLTVFSGFRWVELYDSYGVHGLGYPGDDAFSETVKSHNHMYGYQIGADVDFFPRGQQVDQFGQTMLVFQQDSPFSLKGIVKAGVFYDHADAGCHYSNTAGGTEIWANDSRSHAAFLGEIGLVASYQITPHISLRGGYQVMWIEGVALAVDQIPSTELASSLTSLNTRGSLFCHGAIAGVEVVW